MWHVGRTLNKPPVFASQRRAEKVVFYDEILRQGRCSHAHRIAHVLVDYANIELPRGSGGSDLGVSYVFSSCFLPYTDV